MTSPLRRTGSTNSVSTNENEVQYPVVREYECVKGLKRIQGFNKEQMQNAKDLGRKILKKQSCNSLLKVYLFVVLVCFLVIST